LFFFFLPGTVAEGAPVIPISAQLKYNIEVLCEYIMKKIPVPTRDFMSAPRLIVIRSFDVNKPGCEVDDLKGGVAGGSILRGVHKVGMEIGVRLGLVSKDSEGKLTCRPIFSRIVSLYTEQNELQYAVPGGLIGVCNFLEELKETRHCWFANCFIFSQVWEQRLSPHYAVLIDLWVKSLVLLVLCQRYTLNLKFHITC